MSCAPCCRRDPGPFDTWYKSIPWHCFVLFFAGGVLLRAARVCTVARHNATSVRDPQTGTARLISLVHPYNFYATNSHIRNVRVFRNLKTQS